MSPLPLFFMVLASVALLMALIALWSSLRTALASGAGDGAGESLDTAELPDRAALIDEKKSLLRAIKDLEYEHAVGKIAVEDFERLNHAYRVRAKEVLGLLEKDLLPYQARAEALLATASPAPEPKDEPAAASSEPAKASKKPEPAPAPSESELRDRARALREEAERLERLAAARPASDETKKDEPDASASEGETS